MEERSSGKRVNRTGVTFGSLSSKQFVICSNEGIYNFLVNYDWCFFPHLELDCVFSCSFASVAVSLKTMSGKMITCSFFSARESCDSYSYSSGRGVELIVLTVVDTVLTGAMLAEYSIVALDRYITIEHQENDSSKTHFEWTRCPTPRTCCASHYNPASQEERRRGCGTEAHAVMGTCDFTCFVFVSADVDVRKMAHLSGFSLFFCSLQTHTWFFCVCMFKQIHELRGG